MQLVKSKANGPFEEDDWVYSVMDSLNRYELMYFLEDEFGIHIPDEVGTSLETVRELLDFVENEVAKTS